MPISLTHALTPGANENITDVKENIEDAAHSALGAYRLIHRPPMVALVDTAAGTYWIAEGAYYSSGGGGGVTPSVFYLDTADYAISGMTTKLRLRAEVVSNATASVLTVVMGLYPVTVAGVADQHSLTFGTVVAGSPVTFTSPALSTVAQGTSGDFTIPPTGAYAVGFTINATQANNSRLTLNAHLQLRHVE